MAKFNKWIDKQKGYIYNSDTFGRYKYGIFGGFPNSS